MPFQMRQSYTSSIYLHEYQISPTAPTFSLAADSTDDRMKTKKNEISLFFQMQLLFVLFLSETETYILVLPFHFLHLA